MLCRLESGLDVYQPVGGFDGHLSTTLEAQQSVTKIIFLTSVNLVTPKAGAKHELLFNELALPT